MAKTKYAEGIPPYVFLIHPNDECKVIKVVAGELGYYVVHTASTPEDAREIAERMNDGPLDAAIKEACLSGSMFGWDVPGADPKTYRR